jgi:sugar O-acyltransferase (sialic acid O-acetyltransferase NeuD family)
MKRVVVIGAGGHAREVADIFRHQAQQSNSVTLLGFVVDDPAGHEQTVNGLPVLGDWSWFEEADRDELAVICAVGLPHVRRQLVHRARLRELKFTSAISPLAYVSRDAKIGEGAMIFPLSFTSAGSLIADHAVINVGATVSHDSQVGRYATLSPGVHLAGNVSIGEGCHLGIGASAINGVSIGQWSAIGAGAAVIRNLPDNVTAVGLPAKVIKTKEKGWHEQTTGCLGE